MSRKTLLLDDNRTLVFGYDPPFDTLYAALYERGKGTPYPEDMNNGPGAPTSEAPTRAIGYHPAEQALAPPGTDFGVFPADIGDFDRALREWGIDGDTRERCGRLLAEMEGE